MICNDIGYNPFIDECHWTVSCDDNAVFVVEMRSDYSTRVSMYGKNDYSRLTYNISEPVGFTFDLTRVTYAALLKTCGILVRNDGLYELETHANARKCATVLLVLRRRGQVLRNLDRALVGQLICKKMLLSFSEAAMVMEEHFKNEQRAQKRVCQ